MWCLSQEHSLTQIEIKITVWFEYWLQFWDETQRLGKSSYYDTIISERNVNKPDLEGQSIKENSSSLFPEQKKTKVEERKGSLI